MMRSSTMMLFVALFVAAASASAISLLSDDDFSSGPMFSPKIRRICDRQSQCPIGFDCMGFRCICRKIWDRKTRRCLEFPTTMIPSIVSPTMLSYMPTEIDAVTAAATTTTIQAAEEKQEQFSIRKMLNRFFRTILAFVVYFICATLISMLIIACYLKLMDIPRWNFMCQVIKRYWNKLWTWCTRPEPQNV